MASLKRLCLITVIFVSLKLSGCEKRVTLPGALHFPILSFQLKLRFRKEVIPLFEYNTEVVKTLITFWRVGKDLEIK